MKKNRPGVSERRGIRPAMYVQITLKRYGEMGVGRSRGFCWKGEIKSM